MPCVAAPAAEPARCVRLQIDAVVQRAARRVEGTLTCTLAGAAPTPRRLHVGVPATLLRRPRGRDELRLQRFYPAGFAPGDMQLQGAHGPLPGRGAWREVEVPAGAETVTLHFVTTVPPRDDVLGALPQALHLLYGWHPVLLLPARDPPRRIDYDVQMPPDSSGFVGRRGFATAAASHQRGTYYGHDLPALLARRGALRSTRLPDGSVLLEPQAPPPPVGREALRRPPGSGLQPLSGGMSGAARQQLLEAVATGAATGAHHGLPRRPLWLVVAPLQGRLVAAFDNGLLLSDRAFALPGWRRLQELHRAAIWRAQLALLAAPAVRAREAAAPPFSRLAPPRLADALAAHWRDALLVERTPHAAPGVRSWVDRLAVIPEIDTLLWAPQIPFEEVYFPPIDEAPLQADDPLAARHGAPPGKLLHDKLRDRLGAADEDALWEDYLGQRAPFAAALRRAEASHPELRRDLQAFAGAMPRLNYRLDGPQRTPGAAMPSATVRLQGDGAARVREPLEVDFIDAAGERHAARRLGPGSLFCPTQARLPLRGVQLDPNGRLVETLAPPGFTAAFDNRRPPQWRLLLNNFTSLFALTQGQVALGVNLGLRRLHDLRRDFDLYVMGSPTAWGATVGAHRRFATPVTPLRLAAGVHASLGVARLVPVYQGPLGAQQLDVGVGLSFDDRIAVLTSNQGRGLQATATLGMGRRDDAQRYLYGQLGAAALHIWPLTSQQALLLRLRGDATLGTPPRQVLPALGGRNLGARGFEMEETRGPHRLLASGEWRHVLDQRDYTSLGPLGALHRFDGALFADVAFFPTTPLPCSRRLFADVGYGLRFFLDVFYVVPASLQLDVGVPLWRCAQEASRRLPVTIYASFIQSFSSF